MAEEPGQEPQQGQEPEKVEEPQGEPKTFDEDYVRQLRSEAAKHRKEAQEAKSKIAEFENKDKTELQRAQDRITELEQQGSSHDATVQEYRVKIAVMERASQAGITDPDAATKLLDWSQIEYDDGQPKNIDKLLAKLAEEKPYLTTGRTTTGFDGGARPPASQPQGMDQVIRRAAGRT